MEINNEQLREKPNINIDIGSISPHKKRIS